MVKKIMVIDDIADRKHDCDILLDQNYFVDMQNRYNDKVPIKSKLLLGPQYALLREEFRDLRSQLKVRTGEVNKILVFFGGVDRDNYTMQTIQALSEINIELHVDVVIGFQHPFKSEIKIACVKNGFVFHEQTAYIAKLMADADLAIGAGGSAIWERCCLGLPSLLVALADNQISIARELSSIGACIYIGRSDIADLLELKKYLIELLDNRELIQQLSENAFSIADGLGVYKVMQQMRDSL
jgi:UDP-2,4-diacetamido-2,4,6-trideoxy-beta-L-altropyranose hydrolase